MEIIQKKLRNENEVFKAQIVKCHKENLDINKRLKAMGANNFKLKQEIKSKQDENMELNNHKKTTKASFKLLNEKHLANMERINLIEVILRN